jgi:hypothetical protein
MSKPKRRASRVRPISPGKALFAAVRSASAEPPDGAFWEERIVASIMLITADCTEQEARDCLQPSLDFYGIDSLYHVDAASIANDLVFAAAKRVRDRREFKKWQARVDA